MRKFFTGIWKFISFLFVPQQGRHITEQAQSYSESDKISKFATMTIDKKFISELFNRALVNPRLRINYDMRNTPEDGSQRMLNALLPGTQFQIHRHPHSSESVILIYGSVVEVFYDDNGNETERIPLCPLHGYYGCQVPKGTWHALEVYEPSLIFESKEGRYGADDTEVLSLATSDADVSVKSSDERSGKTSSAPLHDALPERIKSLIEMERHSGSMEVITPLYVSRMLNVPLDEVEAAMKDMDL
jgi:cupin fold WbuC family metalloprotein